MQECTRFTAEMALEASCEGDPIWLDRPAALRICKDHGADLDDFLIAAHDGTDPGRYDAGSLLIWLGY